MLTHKTYLQNTKFLFSIALNLLAVVYAAELFFNLLSQNSELIYYSVNLGMIFLSVVLLLELFTPPFKLQRIFGVLPDVIFLSVGLILTKTERVFELYILSRQTFYFIRSLALSDQEQSLFDKLSKNPPVFVLLSFLFTIFVGTLFLLLPDATVEGKSTSILDALFTSTSATCVTGLIVQDTGTHFTMFGQLIILSLIQIGGLGIMTISSAFAIMLGQKLTMRSENLIQNVVGESNRVDMANLVRSIIFVTILIELAGIILLYFSWKKPEWSVQKNLYNSVFHSISAFCNAGFSLHSNSLMGYLSDIKVNLTISSLIILGGIGFPVMVDVNRNIFHKFHIHRLALHTKIVLFTTFFLIAVGFLAFFIGEYNSTMKGFNLNDRMLASYFQSVTTRTAGFNTIDNGEMSLASVFVSCILMFIGASPSSTGGGVKTTTFFIILLSVFSMLSGNKDLNVFKRKVPEDVIKKILALIAISLFILFLLIFLLLLSEDSSFEKIIFEAFSAYGTVGLSMGITSSLTNLGRIIIIILMYLGRVGPLTLIFAISETKIKTTYHYTEEKISIG